MTIATLVKALHQKLLTILSAYLQLLPNSTLAWGSLGLAIALAVFTLARLRSFVRPDWPLLSPFIRWWAKTIAFPIAFLFGVALIASLPLALLLSKMLGHFHAVYDFLLPLGLSLATGLVAGSGVSLWIWFYAIPKIERTVASDTTKPGSAMNPGRSQIGFKKPENGCFVGLSRASEPIYIPWKQLNTTHVQIIGETGGGKGMSLGNMLDQCARVGQSVVFFDPKHDRYTPKILALAAKEMSRKFALLDLNSTEITQVNPLFGCTAIQIEEMLIAGFSLQATGSDGDYHRGRDQDAAALAAQLAVDDRCNCFPALLEKCLTVPEIAEQDNFLRKLRQLSALRAVCTVDGVDLAEFINGGHVLYIIGSTDNERVKMLQKMLLIRVLQIIKSRPRMVTRPVAVGLDEFKYLLSPTALSALGVARDFDSHFFLGHQSLSDLRQCVGVDPEAAYGAVVDNTGIKIVYKISDTTYAERLSALSGTRKVFRENLDQSVQLGEAQRRTWREEYEPLIKPEHLLRLPKPTDHPKGLATGVVFGLKEPYFFQIAPIPVDGLQPSVIWSATPYGSGMPQHHPEDAI